MDGITSISAKAHAKINLFLHITGKLPNGYHALESLFAKLHLHDDITVKKSSVLSCHVTGANINEPNIVLKAAEKLRQFANIDDGAEIYIQKRIPIAAGLGGGSADAATVLRLLVQLWDIKITEQELLTIGLSVGADVPYCLQDATAFVSGVGEVIKPITLDTTLELVLINSGHHVLTAEIFKHVKSFSQSIEKQNDSETMLNLLITGRNDLQEPAHVACPELDIVRDTLMRAHGVEVVRMSGSGATYFGIFDSKSNAEAAAREISQTHQDWLVWHDTIAI